MKLDSPLCFFKLFYQLIGQCKGVDLPTVMWINLEHVGHPEAFERSMQWGNMLAIFRRYYGLSKRRRKQPALFDPRWIKFTPDALQVGQKLVEDLFLAHFEER